MKKNYYTIHKNKKKRKDIYNKKVWSLIRRCEILVKNAIIAAKSLRAFSKSINDIAIPNYKKGGISSIIVGADFGNGRDYSAESIILPNGIIQVLPPDKKLYKGECTYIIEDIGQIESTQDFSKANSIEMFRQMVANGELNYTPKANE